MIMELYLVFVTLSALLVAPTLCSLYFCTKNIPNADDEYKKRIDEEYFNVCVKPVLDAKVDTLVDKYWESLAKCIARAYIQRPMSYNVFSNQKEWYLKIPANYHLNNSIAMFNEYQKKKFIEDIFQKITKGYWFDGKLKSLTYGSKKGPVYFIAVIERYVLENKEVHYNINSTDCNVYYSWYQR